MRRLSLVFLSIVFLLGACTGGERSGINPGDKAPNINGVDLAGAPLSLYDIKGKAYLLNFWATWCPPCVAELPQLQALHEKYRDQGLQVVAVAVDDVSDEVARFKAKYNLTFPILLDAEGSSRRAYGLKGLPESFVLDQQFKIAMLPDPETQLPVTRIIGPREWLSPAITNTLETILK
jgi:peroxiredoxin